MLSNQKELKEVAQSKEEQFNNLMHNALVVLYNDQLNKKINSIDELEMVSDKDLWGFSNSRDFDKDYTTNTILDIWNKAKDKAIQEKTEYLLEIYKEYLNDYPSATTTHFVAQSACGTVLNLLHNVIAYDLCDDKLINHITDSIAEAQKTQPDYDYDYRPATLSSENTVTLKKSDFQKTLPIKRFSKDNDYTKARKKDEDKAIVQTCTFFPVGSKECIDHVEKLTSNTEKETPSNKGP